MTEAALNRIAKTKSNLMNWTGKSHTEETKSKIREWNLGRKMSPEACNKMSESAIKRIEQEGFKLAYKGKFRPNHPEKYDGDPTNIVYRSGLELRFMQYLDSNSGVLKWQSEEFFIPYFDPSTSKWRRYFVDFLVVVKQGDGTLTQLVEIKPDSQTRPPKVPAKKTRRFINEMLTYGTNQAKWLAAEEYCKDRNWKFKIITDKDLKVF